jgi:capsular exopolysaccharide synthesis family protein
MRDRNDLILRDGLAPPPHEQRLMPYAPGVPGPYAPLPPQAQPRAGELDLFRGILRHAWLVVIFSLIGLGGAWFYLKHATPIFRAYAKIYIEPSGPRVTNEPASAVQRNNYLNTQAEVIRSSPVLNIVAETPGVKDLKTFAKSGGHVQLFLREYLKTEVGRKDDIISIEIDSPYATDTAAIVNAVVDAYQRYQSLEKQTASSISLKSLLETKGKEDDALAQLLDKMNQFQRMHPNLRLEPVVTAEVQAHSKALLDARLAMLDIQAKWGEKHPSYQAATKKYQELERLNEESIQKSAALNTQVAEFQRLDTDLKYKEGVIKALDERIRVTELNADAEQRFNMVTVLEPAVVPVQPSSPRRYRTIALALAGGMMLGAGLALLRERLDGRMRSVEEIQTIIGLPVLGVVPQMSGRRTAVARAMTVHLDPRSVVAESYRTIRTAVYFGAGSNNCKTLLVTSPEPGDGKTTSASNLAIAIAQTGRSVLLLDADFRKPTQAKNLDINDNVGLSSVLAGREPIERAIQHTGVEGLDILPCGPIPANPSEILNSREFGELVDRFAQKYDHIIFDSPPVNAVTDARILGAVCDATILVLRADKSTRKSGEHARNALISVGARVLGVIVNDAPHRKGYEVYGGSYYGQADIAVRSSDGHESVARARRILPKPTAEVTE